MARIKKPCSNCGSLERYSNGGCKPCQLKKQTLRNQDWATGDGKIYAKNSIRKSEARELGESKYESVNKCTRCGGVVRYVSRGNCMGCNYSGAPDDPENKPGRMKTR